MKYIILTLILTTISLSVAQTGTISADTAPSTETGHAPIEEDLKSFIREASRHTRDWGVICRDQFTRITRMFKENDLPIETIPITSGILPKDTPQVEFVRDLVFKAREHDPTYGADYSMFDDMDSIFLLSEDKTAKTFIINIPVDYNQEADGFCFGEWVSSL